MSRAALTLDEQVAELVASGFRVVQRGAVTRAGAVGLSFADRVEGCNVPLIKSGDVLIDDDEGWVHLTLRPSALP